jgi:hypothetical protein
MFTFYIFAVNPTHMLQFIISVSIIAFVYRNILLKPQMILGWLADWMDSNAEKWHYIIYPMGYCSKCFAGQLALWSWLYYMDSWRLFEHLTVICASIFGAWVLDVVFKKYLE